MEGKHFYIKSQLNGLVLDVEGANGSPGTPVVMWHQKYGGDADNQLWFEDEYSGTIRSKLNPSLCLEVQGDSLVINDYNPGEYNQRWMCAGDRVQNRDNPSAVFDIADNNNDPGARVCSWDFHGASNQLWEFEYQPAQFFYIRSRLSDKVLDVRGADSSPGAEIITYDQGGGNADNQLWYEDRYGVIRSKMNDFAMDASDGYLRTNPHDPGNPRQQWIVGNDRIFNRHNPGEVLDISGNDSGNCASIIPYDDHGGDNQRWTFEYI